jgi:Uma2 family endonuclease
MAMPETTLVTADELLTKRFPEKHVELVAGIVRHMTPAGGMHGALAAELLRVVANHVHQHELGRAFIAETGFILARDPDTVRAPDVAFISTARLQSRVKPQGFIEGGPDLAVEVLSPDDSWSEISAKVAEYFRADTRAVWVVDPSTRTVTVHESEGANRRLDESQHLDGGAVLAGFSHPIRALFD